MFIRQMSGGSRQQVPGRNLTMHEHRQSYRAVVPAKFPNKTGPPTVAEEMEGRALVKGNEFQRNTIRAQYRRIVPRELERMWVMVIEGVHEILLSVPILPAIRTGCVNRARPGPCGGRGAIPVPTATVVLDSYNRSRKATIV